eukprot:Sspe_Gene.49395::Locus_26596_Transcript_1_1_Confidence_1.000_Length_1196::g.49395::m.49395/K05309/PTGES2; microsomal prostaglandin-E synthase 2
MLRGCTVPVRRALGVRTCTTAVSRGQKRYSSSTILLGAMAVVGAGGVTYAARLGKNKSLTAEAINSQGLPRLNQMSVDELREKGVTMYRYLTCPFCGKLKAFLDYHRIPITFVEVDPLFKAQMKGLNYSKVPLIKIGEEITLADSYDIVTHLNEKITGSPATEDTLKWRQWASEEFVRYLTLNLNRTLSDAWESSRYIDTAPEIPAMNRFLSKAVGAPMMYLIVQHMITRPKLMKMGYDGGDERAALYRCIDKWVVEGVKDQPFHGGSSPDTADTDVYGVLNAIRGYPLYFDAIKNSKAKDWVHRMDAALGREPAAEVAASIA